MSTIELSEQAKHQDWMEKMEDLTQQIDLLNQNLTMVFASISERLDKVTTTKKVRISEKV